MDITVLMLLALIGVLALLLPYFKGLLKKPVFVVCCAVFVAAAFVVRALCLNHVTLDYTTFLARWVQFYRDNGGVRALGQSIGNYNVPYLYFLCLFSYLGINDLYLIKLLSILFDVVLAWSATLLLSRFTNSPAKLLACYLTVLLCPTVVLNGAYWGQCDSIYAAFAVLSLYLAMSDHPIAGMACIAVSFGFKLQAVFLMPVFVVLWIAGRVRWQHFLVFPAVYILLVLPAVIAGRPFLDTLTLYFSQMDTVGSALNYNSPSIFAFVYSSNDPELLSKLGIAAAFLLMLAVFVLCAAKRRSLSDLSVLSAALVLCVGIPFFLPHMHDRYFFIADVVSVVFAFCLPEYFALPVLCQFASLLGYHAYLKQRYLLPMRYGAAALGIVLVVAFAFLGGQLQQSDKRRKQKA